MQLLISLTLAVVILAINVITKPVNIAEVILGALLAAFIMDSEYFLYAYFLEPTKDFSKNLITFLSHHDFKNALTYIQYHRDEITDSSLKNVLFQVILAPLGILAVYAAPSYFVKALVLGLLVNSIYQLTEDYLRNNYLSWFWPLKDKPTKKGVLAYILGLTGILIFSITLFR